MDFNSRSLEQPHVSHEPQIDISLELFLQELDILFKTEKAAVFGNRQLGSSMESLLWKTTMNADYMKVKIADDIRKTCLMHEYYTWTIDVKIFPGSHRDIALLDVVIRDKFTDEEVATKKFQFR